MCGFDTAWDDGTHVHVSHDGQDTTFDDDLHSLGARPASTAPAETSAFPVAQVDGLGGSGIRQEFELGANHFWLTFGCCGEQGGLFVAKVR